MQKKIFFENINNINLIFALILFPFFGKIIYRKSKILQKESFFNKFLEKTFFCKIGLRNLNCKYNNRGIITKKILIERFYTNVLSKNFVYKNFLKEKKYTSQQIEKIKICLWDEFKSEEDDFNIQVTSYILLKKNYLLNEKKILYFAQDLSSYLLLKQLKNKNLKVLWIIAVINHLFFIFFKTINFLYIKLKNLIKINLASKNSKKNHSLSIDKAAKFNFAFFPHVNSLKYGISFNKIFIYENDKNSLLHKEKVLTVWSNPPDNLTLRYLKKNNIPFLIMLDHMKSISWFKENTHLIKNNFSQIIKPSEWNINNFSILKLLFFFNRKLTRSKKFINNLINLKAFFVDFDHLFPKVFVFAADLVGKKSISYQERTLAHLWYPNLIYNYYLINGKNCQNMFEKIKYQVDKYLVVGMHRTRLIKLKNKPSYEYERIKKIKEKYNLVLCLSLLRCNDYLIDIIGEDGTSIRSEIKFYSDLIKLARKFKDHYFLIKPKGILEENLLNDYPKEILENLKKLPNIELHNNTKINSYELAYFADLAIGKQTTLMEEILSIKKPVIYHDPENNMSTFKYEINKLDLIVKNYKQLELKVIKNINSKGSLDKKTLEYIDKFLINENNLIRVDLIVANIKQILNKYV